MGRMPTVDSGKLIQLKLNSEIESSQDQAADLVSELSPDFRADLKSDSIVGDLVHQIDIQRRVHAALACVEEGAMIDRHFGITSGDPLQSADDAFESDMLLSALQDARTEADYDEVLMGISEYAERSSLDPNALRALRRGRVV